MDASGADLIIASGSMHYFEYPLSQMIERLSKRPKHILINRTPLSENAPLAVVQEQRNIRVACFLYNRDEIITDFASMGYTLIDSWQVAELGIRVPGNPEHSIANHSGLFFECRNCV